MDGILSMLGDLVHNGMQTGASLLSGIASGPLNIWTYTPPELTYAHPAVVEMSGHLRLVAYGALALLFVIAGFIKMAAPIMGSDLPLRVLAVRAVVAVVSASTVLWWAGKFVDLVNALNASIMSAPLGSLVLPWPTGLDPVQLLAGLLYAVVVLLLFVKLAMRVVWLMVLLAIAPIALILYVVPQLAFVSSAWAKQFFGNLFGQPLTLIALRLGSVVLMHESPSVWDYFIGAVVLLVAMQMPVWFSMVAVGARTGGALANMSPGAFFARGLGAVGMIGGAGLAVRGAAALGGRAVAVSAARVNHGMRVGP